MKKSVLFLICFFACSLLAIADNGPYHFQRVVNSATTTTANAWCKLLGSNTDSKKIMIVEDSRTMNIKIAFSIANTTNASYWLQCPVDGIFDQPVKLDTNYGIYVSTTDTATVRMMLIN
jgi:hypothetical protein